MCVFAYVGGHQHVNGDLIEVAGFWMTLFFEYCITHFLIKEHLLFISGGKSIVGENWRGRPQTNIV